jgi:hypothetical protein
MASGYSYSGFAIAARKQRFLKPEESGHDFWQAGKAVQKRLRECPKCSVSGQTITFVSSVSNLAYFALRH